MVKYRLQLILQCLIVLIPLNIFMWGDWLIINLQWALFRYQNSPYGDSLIPIYKDINYILLGQTTGIHQVLAALFWVAGGTLVMTGLFVVFFAAVKGRSDLVKKASVFTIAGGIFFGLSALERFAGGFAVPVGIPMVIFSGWWMYHADYGPEDSGDEPEGKDLLEDD